MVEHQLPKLRVAGSSPVARSKFGKAMENQFDFVSIVFSALLHALVIMFISLFQNFKPVGYTVVDASTFSLNTEVRSKFISTKSNDSKSKNPLSNKGITDAPSGIKVAGSSSKNHCKAVSNMVGNLFSREIAGNVGSKSSNYFVSRQEGNHGMNLSLSTGFSDQKGHMALRTMRSKMAPYLLKVKHRILSNWQNPCDNFSYKAAIIKCNLDASGRINSLNFEKLSSSSVFNRSAVMAIYKAEPFPPIPLRVNKISLRIKFETK